MSERKTPPRDRPVVRMTNPPTDKQSEEEYRQFLAKAKSSSPVDREKLAKFQEVIGAINADQAAISSAAEEAEEAKATTAPKGKRATKAKLPKSRVPDATGESEDEEAEAWADDPDNPYAYMQYRNTPIDNPRFRQEIEERCEEVDWAGILEGVATQRVPIQPDILEVTFQTIAGDRRLYIDERWGKEVQGKTEMFASNLLQIYTLAMGVKDVNGVELPRLKYVADTDEVDTESFSARVARVKKLSEEMLDLLMTNHTWFRMRVMWRVRKGAVGNG